MQIGLGPYRDYRRVSTGLSSRARDRRCQNHAEDCDRRPIPLDDLGIETRSGRQAHRSSVSRPARVAKRIVRPVSRPARVAKRIVRPSTNPMANRPVVSAGDGGLLLGPANHDRAQKTHERRIWLLTQAPQSAEA
jgi:hypothetical protein